MDSFLTRIANQSGLHSRTLRQFQEDLEKCFLLYEDQRFKHMAIIAGRLAQDHEEVVYDIYDYTPVHGKPRKTDKWYPKMNEEI